MKERILEFLRKENKSSVQFAQDIGVQPSGISHIISGRNKPSLDFVLKMLERYPFLSTDWLLFGKGPMYKEQRIPTLFDDLELNITEKTLDSSQILKPDHGNDERKSVLSVGEKPDSQDSVKPGIVRIIWFYDNKSFEEFSPSNE